MAKIASNVYLVGAGAGNVDLLTLEAIKVLKKADVVLYDALVGKDILDFTKDNALLIHVGKRKDNHSKKQEEINDLLKEYAKQYQNVVRLKGGTPFVFGRGYEEVRALREIGIEVKIISGVSSTTAVPESFMIPLIDRMYSDSYRTITGHNIEVFSDIVNVYHPRENLIVMMGIHNLKKIVEVLLKKGFPSSLSLAILSKGTTDESLKLVFSLEEILAKDETFFESIKSLTPAILFIGRGLEL